MHNRGSRNVTVIKDQATISLRAALYLIKLIREYRGIPALKGIAWTINISFFLNAKLGSSVYLPMHPFPLL